MIRGGKESTEEKGKGIIRKRGVALAVGREGWAL